MVYVDVPATLRAARRLRNLNQRELAAYAGLPRSTVERIEAGLCDPRVGTLLKLLDALGLELAVCDTDGVVLRVDPEQERLFDAAGRHFPAHCSAQALSWRDEEEWWRWSRRPAGAPTHTYRRRRPDRPTSTWSDDDRDTRWDDAT